MKKLLKIALLASSVTLIACSSIKQPRSFDQLGTYQSIPLNQNTFRISFSAKGNWAYGVSEEITLVKAAQITIKNGFDMFKVIDDPSNRVNNQPARQAIVYPNRGFYSPFWYDPLYDQPYVVNVENRDVSYTIQAFKRNQAPQDAFDARSILSNIGHKYGVTANGDVLPPPDRNKK